MGSSQDWGSRESVVGEWKTSVWETSVSKSWQHSSLVSITSLPLSSSISSGSVKSSLELSLGSSNLGSIFNSNWNWEIKDWSLQWSSLGDGGTNREVGSSNSESVDGISNIVDSLEETISINILI